MRNTKILKPCPFCGGKANMKYDALLSLHWEGKVYCRECKAEIKRTAVCPSNLDERLIESWNKRSEEV